MPPTRKSLGWWQWETLLVTVGARAETEMVGGYTWTGRLPK